jgi:diguanylate cyclase (GGDEF)-like protein
MAEERWSLGAALDALLETMDEGVVLYDERLRCRAAGRRIRELFGLEPAALIGQTRAEVVRRMASSSDVPFAILSTVGDEAVTHESTVADPLELHRPRLRTVAWTSVPIVVSGQSAGRVDVVRDVTRERGADRAIEEMAKRLQEVSTIDPVTGLPNRRRFEQESDREHRRAQRAWDSYAIFRLDVDGMSQLNSTHGEAIGDELLRRIGEDLRTTRREYDVVARWAEDEFIVLLPGADVLAAKTVVKRAVKALKEKTFDLLGGLQVTVSAGAAVWIPPSGEGAEDIIRRAGAALDVARGKGAGSTEVDGGLGQWKDDLSES